MKKIIRKYAKSSIICYILGVTLKSMCIYEQKTTIRFVMYDYIHTFAPQNNTICYHKTTLNMKKYYKSKQIAIREANKHPAYKGIHVFKMPKGTRHSGEYAVCTYLEFLNTY